MSMESMIAKFLKFKNSLFQKKEAQPKPRNFYDYGSDREDIDWEMVFMKMLMGFLMLLLLGLAVGIIGSVLCALDWNIWAVLKWGSGLVGTVAVCYAIGHQ